MPTPDNTGKQHIIKRSLGERSSAIHVGEEPDAVTHASAPNLVMSTTFVVPADAGFSAEAMGEDPGFVYTRWGNPTVHQLELKLADLENGETAVCFGSGMAALYGVFLHTLKAGDHAVVSDVTYAALSESSNEVFPELGIEITRVDTSNPENVRSAMKPNTKLVHIESPCNPLLRLTDIAAVAEVTHAGGALLSIDSTFGTPTATKPLELGADYVIHSLTKYLGGHGDAVGGVVIGSRALVDGMRRSTALRLGGILSPFNAWLIMRGLATFHLRMKAHEESAMKVAQWLETVPAVKRVIYPGLPSHPQYELAQRQMKNMSGMITFQVEDGPKAAHVLAEYLQMIHYAVSLGHHRSLIFYMGTDDLLQTTFKLTPDQLASWRTYAGDGVFRLSVGLEDAEDIIADLEGAFAHL